MRLGPALRAKLIKLKLIRPRIRIESKYIITHGKQVQVQYNHVVSAGLYAILALLATVDNSAIVTSLTYANTFGNGMSMDDTTGSLRTWAAGTYSSGLVKYSGINDAAATGGMSIGTDTTHTTTFSTYALGNPLGIAPSSTGAPSITKGTTSFTLTQTWTWNAGTITNGTVVTECGLLVNLWTTAATNNYPFLATRLSTADSTFTSVTINSTLPFVITWQLTVTYS